MCNTKKSGASLILPIIELTLHDWRDTTLVILHSSEN